METDMRDDMERNDFLVRVDRPVYNALREIAINDDRSVSWVARHLIRQSLTRDAIAKSKTGA
jgi:predicted transcriptional regulator